VYFLSFGVSFFPFQRLVPNVVLKSVYHLGNCKSILCLVVAAVITVILGRIVVYSTCFGVLSDNDDAENHHHHDAKTAEVRCDDSP